MSLRIEKLTRQHVLDGFDCGHEALNRFLLRYAWPNQQANASQTYVGLDDDAVIGFYTLVVGEVAYDGAPLRSSGSTIQYHEPLRYLDRVITREYGDNMIRTQISFVAEDYASARRLAERRGVSLAELCRRGVREAVQREKQQAGEADKPWMRHAGAFASGDARASESVDAVVYDRVAP